MTRDDIIRMAQQARLDSIAILSEHWIGLKHFAVLVAEHEREACAKECEMLRPIKPEYDRRFYDACMFSAAAIRARGQE